MNILVIKPSSLGDVVHALPFLHALKEGFPDAHIDWVISKNLKGILENHPLISELILLDKDSWKRIKSAPKTVAQIASLNKRLRSKHYDIVVDLQGLLRSGLMALSTSDTFRVGFADAREGSRLMYDKKVATNGSIHAVDKCLDVAKALGATIKDIRFPLVIDENAQHAVDNLLAGIKNYVMVVPSSRWITKRWPADHFAALISRIPLPVVIVGSGSDKEIAKTIKKHVKRTDVKNEVIDLCGKTDLKELVALISKARVVITNDSGPMHIAVALKKPVVSIFGPTDPDKTGPYGWRTNKNLKVVRVDVSCSPCRKKKTCNDFMCMKRISADQVFDALKEYI